MNTAKSICFWMVFTSVIIAAYDAHAASVNFTLDNVLLADSTQMTGTFSWTFDIGDFENGVGQFSSLVIPYTKHNQDDLNATIDVGQSIEITLEGSVHDDGVDITLVLLQPLTPITSSSIDPSASKYEIGGNGFHDGFFKSGSISPSTQPGDANYDSLIDGGDYTIWADHYLQTGQTWETGDFNGDGIVDGGDYTIWADHYTPAARSVRRSRALDARAVRHRRSSFVRPWYAIPWTSPACVRRHRTRTEG